MLKKSRLLEYLLSLAEELKNKDGRRGISANYFVISVLRTLDAVENGHLPDGINDEETKNELYAVRDMLATYKIDSKRTAEAISAELTSSDYSAEADERMFAALSCEAELKAKTGGSETVDAKVYFELVIAKPTAAIDKHIVSSAKKAEEKSALGADVLAKLKGLFGSAEKKTPEESVDVASNETSNDNADPKTLFGVGKTSDEPVDSNTSSDPVETEPKALSDIVETARSIQRLLLDSIFGQDQAVNSFVSGYFQSQLMSCARKGSNKPKATFLFAGPPGVGKTFLAEKSAEALGLPYMRFDMSEYSDDEANIEFCGSDKVYKNGKAGNVTGFVAKHPKCVLLFDEIEKAHINVIYLFLQILDAGRIRDNYTDVEIPFSDAIIIFTTNVGRKLYDDPAVVNLSAVPRKKVLKALETEVDPNKKSPLFPAAICSRFASGNVVMFNRLESNNLYTIAKRELDNNVKGLEEATGVKISVDSRVPSAIMFSEGGKADARTVKGRANSFFYEELYELFRLLASSKGAGAIDGISHINIDVPLENMPENIREMFECSAAPEVLVFASGKMAEDCEQKLRGTVKYHLAASVEEAKEILFHYDISIALCDVSCGVRSGENAVLNAEDISSEGHDFLSYALERHSLPVYIMTENEGDISQEEFLSFAKLGVRDMLTLNGSESAFAKKVASKCEISYQQGKMMKLARENKALSYKTSQTVSEDGKTATVNLFDFRFSLITDTDDSKNIIDNVSRPDLHFDDVIGAEDAKEELKYFVEYLKNPIKYMRRGVRSPKGVLLYGPPGTGKTLLAKAMAGECGVTFMRAEGNEFLKPYDGGGSEAVHSLFNAARKYAPSIIFIDEIDAIGKSREIYAPGDFVSNTLTALLTEMDGFNTDTSKPVFVLAATNYDVDSSSVRRLDEALLRRFDRRIYVDLPNKEERKRYLEMKLERHTSVRLSDEQLENVAVRSTGMSLAALESVFELALRNAIRSESGIVGDAEFEEAFESFNSGEKKKWNPVTLERTARHEAGHALMCWLSGDKPTYLTVVARGDHGGYMQHANDEDKGLYTKSELLGRIRTALGGRASEIVYYGTEDGFSTGASGDLYTATRIAEQMICNYGMDSSVGMSYIDSAALSSPANQSVRERVNAMLESELSVAVTIIEKNRRAIDAIVESLLVKNHLKENEIDDIFKRTAVKSEV